MVKLFFLLVVLSCGVLGARPPCKGLKSNCDDENAIYKACPEPCPTTCAQREPWPCPRVCEEFGCECVPGFILSEFGGKCISLDECPETDGCNGDPNAMPDECPSACPPTCGSLDLGDILCPAVCDPSKCSCKPGFMLTRVGGKCVRPEDCPVTTISASLCSDPNASPRRCPSSCQPTCEQPNNTAIPCTKDCLESGCVCNQGFILDEKDGECILISDCPDDQSCNGDENAYIAECPNPCPATCEEPDTSNKPCPLICLPPGCDCKPGFVLNEIGGECIPLDECPVIDSCNGDPNASPQECPSLCPPTCGLQDFETPCPEGCNPSGCVCKPGFILTELGGKCVAFGQCPEETCEGDPNAMPTGCGSACPPTCRKPDTTFKACNQMCETSGCTCKDGHILTEIGGECVLPASCPGGPPKCPKNKTLVYCAAGCPESYCPEDDSRDIIACDPPYPCPAGCTCKNGYLMLSYENPRCILSSECPPVECTRPNEVWNPAPTKCDNLKCEEMNTECSDSSTAAPGCVCEPGFFRDENDICVPASECRVFRECSDPNASPQECPRSCQATCDRPNLDDVLCTDNCLPSGCVCNPGFILREFGGLCIPISECPDCNGDPNAVFDECPYACPVTCDSPDRSGMGCIQACDPKGCVCKRGYIPTVKGGRCVLPDDCPGGKPACGGNKTFTSCVAGCPTDYCPQSDSRAIPACWFPTGPLSLFRCSPGCICNQNHLMLSDIDTRCVLSTDCPPVTCTRPNEVWDPSPQICFSERCEERNIPCDFPDTRPRCICKPGFCRNEDDICIRAPKC